MARSARALVRPELLVWARKSAGLEVEEAARKVAVKPDRLEAWEKGDLAPTINQLRKLGKAYKRPIAVFYLPKAPKDFAPLKDLRSLPGALPRLETSALKLAIRNAHTWRAIALDLYEDLGGKAPAFRHKAALTDDPDELATRVRRALGVTPETQVALRDKYQALRTWRSALEAQGVLVFQASGIDLSEMRGFSLSERPLPVVVVNNKDAPLGRIFTMLHEFIHLLLHDGGLCDLHEDAPRSPDVQKLEVFCNRVAGAVLVPKDQLLSEDIVARTPGRRSWNDVELSDLARRYWVSQEVVLRRLLICDRTTNTFYKQKRKDFIEAYKQLPKKKSDPVPIPPFRKTISRVGHAFIRLVLNSYYNEVITARDLSSFLDLRIKHMGKVEREVMGRAIEFGALP